MAIPTRVKQKTRKAAAKRFTFSKKGKAMRRHTMQDHFNVGRSKKTIRRRRSNRPVHSSDIHRLTGMLPFTPPKVCNNNASCQG